MVGATRMLQHVSLLGLLVGRVLALGVTDFWRDADAAQSSYVGGHHNLDPAVVDSPDFGILWKTDFSEQERHYARPLLYTPSSTEKQIVFLASTNNTIRTLDAETGEVLNERNVGEPFLMAQAYCTQIAETLGVLGTPVIDPETDTAYFFAKVNIPYFRDNSTNIGILNGAYYFFGVDVSTLEDRPGFPILVDGIPADNDARKYFIGGTILQRPSLVQLGDVVYGGFGDMCDAFNVTGTVIGVDVKQAKIVTNFVTQAGPDAPYTDDWTAWHGGGPGGIWQGGHGLSTDGNSIFFVVDNGGGSTNGEIDTTPARGNSSISVLSESIVRVVPNPDGGIQVQDFFRPYDYQSDAGGDIGSGGLSILDPVFGTPSVKRIGIQASKNRHIRVVDLSDLGGYRQGPDGKNNIIQSIDIGRGEGDTGGEIFGGGGSYPLDGGYIYVAPINMPLAAYKLVLSEDGDGKPSFELAGRAEVLAGITRGAGIPTTTSFNEQPGTGIVWVTDTENGLRAWYAVPTEEGVLKQISLPKLDGANKFSRAGFGNGKVYVVDSKGSLVCLGSSA